MKREKIIQGKKCYIFENGQSDIVLMQAVNDHEWEQLDREVEMIKQFTNNMSFTFVAYLIEDWNNELSPWDAPAVFGSENFVSRADATLSFVTDALISELYGKDEKKRYYLGGYSLAGLFALWAAYQTDLFCGIAAVSPSVWFPGWRSYIESKTIHSSKIYLSLGDKEEKAKNKTVAAVGDNIRFQHELLNDMPSVTRCTLEWNPGNHFVDFECRTAKGFAWLLSGK